MKINFNQHGFSLIELCIIVLIIAILATISYPVYTSHIRKTHRAEAKATLFKLASNLEEYYAMHHSYEGATLNQLGITPISAYYQFNILSAGVDHYFLQAIPFAKQSLDDCGVLGIDHLAKKSRTGHASISECWD